MEGVEAWLPLFLSAGITVVVIYFVLKVFKNKNSVNLGYFLA